MSLSYVKNSRTSSFLSIFGSQRLTAAKVQNKKISVFVTYFRNLSFCNVPIYVTWEEHDDTNTPRNTTYTIN